jgi:hypothetical protein
MNINDWLSTLATQHDVEGVTSTLTSVQTLVSNQPVRMEPSFLPILLPFLLQPATCEQTAVILDRMLVHVSFDALYADYQVWLYR